MKKFRIFVSIFVLTIMLALIAYTYIVRIIPKNPMKSFTPVASGDFPASPIWVFAADEEIITAPATHNHTAFVRTNNYLYSIDIQEQIVNWKITSIANQSPDVAPLILDQQVIVVEAGSVVAAYSIENGSLMWKTSEIEIAKITAAVETMAFNERYLYVARFDWQLTAYDRETGETVWEYALPGRSDPYIAANESMVVLAVDETISALDANTGKVLWQISIPGYAGPLLLSGNQLFVTDEKSVTLQALDLSTGQNYWIADFSSVVERYYYSCVVETNEALLIAANKLIMVSKADGGIIWSSDDLGTLECPSVGKESVFIRNTKTDLFRMDLATGAISGKLSVLEDTFQHNEPFRTPVLSGEFLLVPLGDNRLSIYKVDDL